MMSSNIYKYLKKKSKYFENHTILGYRLNYEHAVKNSNLY